MQKTIAMIFLCSVLCFNSNLFTYAIDKDNIKVTISKKDHDLILANQIIRKIQEEYTNKMYITVKFQ